MQKLICSWKGLEALVRTRTVCYEANLAWR